MFAVLHSDINSHKSGLLHLTGQPYRSAKVKDGIINLLLRNNLIDRYSLMLKLILVGQKGLSVSVIFHEYQSNRVSVKVL
jgi:hypothetical protein